VRVPLPCAGLEIVLVHHEPHEPGGIHKRRVPVPDRIPDAPRQLQPLIAEANLAEAGRIRAGPLPVRGDSCCGCVGIAPGGNVPGGLDGSGESEGRAPDGEPYAALFSLVRSAQHPDGSADHVHHEEREKGQEREGAPPLHRGDKDDGDEEEGFDIVGSFHDTTSVAAVTGTAPSGQGPLPALSIALPPVSPFRRRSDCPPPGGLDGGETGGGGGGWSWFPKFYH